MFDYEEQANDFLEKANAKIQFIFLGTEINKLWKDDKYKHDKFHVIITTPKGNMDLDFWDSAHNTERRHRDKEAIARQMFTCSWQGLGYSEQRKVRNILQKEKEEVGEHPTAYSVLAYLEKYDVGSLDDFMQEFGYTCENADDIANLLTTYNGVCKEYRDLCRIFTPEQMEELREIN